MNIETYKDGKLIKTEIVPDPPKSADDTRLDSLRAKIAADTATALEVRETLKLLMKAGRL